MSDRDLTELTPAEIDIEWVVALQPALRIDQQLKITITSLKKYRHSGYEATVDRLEARKNDLELKLAEARRVEQRFDDEYERRGGWTRFLVVANSNGHLHRFPGSCRTLRPGETLVVPVPQFSGMPDDLVVDAVGHQACSVCFPDAPVVTAADRERVAANRAEIQRQDRERKRQEKLAKQATRARRLMRKVEAAYEQLGGFDFLMSLPRIGPDSPYNLLITSDLQVTVQNVILDDLESAHGQRRGSKDPREIIAEADELGV